MYGTASKSEGKRGRVVPGRRETRLEKDFPLVPLFRLVQKWPRLEGKSKNCLRNCSEKQDITYTHSIDVKEGFGGTAAKKVDRTPDMGNIQGGADYRENGLRASVSTPGTSERGGAFAIDSAKRE